MFPPLESNYFLISHLQHISFHLKFVFNILPLAACRLPLAACRLPLAACRLPLAACRFSSILQHKDMTIFVVTQLFCKKNDYYFRHFYNGFIICGL